MRGRAPRQVGRPVVAALHPNAGGGGGAGLAAPATVWLLEFDRARVAALPADSVLEAVVRPRIIGVPGAPYCALGMLAWQGRYLAVLDLGSLLDARPKGPCTPPTHAVVVACRTGPDQPIEYAAIAAIGLSQAVQLADAVPCPLPHDSDLWPLIALSCFRHRGRAVPIIDPGKLFTSHWD